MYALAVALAVVAALLIAFGAELQEHAAVRVSPRRNRLIAFFVQLLRDTGWVIGALSVATGVAVHIVALTNGPVAAVQPVGSVGVLFAVGIKAGLDRTRIERPAVLGSVAVIVGLVTLLMLLPHGTGTATVRPSAAVTAGVCAVGVTVAALLVNAGGVRSGVRAGALALGAGMCFGVSAALIGVVGRRTSRDLAAVVSWQTLLVVVLLVCGGVAQQLAYRVARFALVYAVLLTVDPLTAGLTGVLLLGEPMPSTRATRGGLVGAAVLVVTGIVVLAHARAANRTTAPRVPQEAESCAS
jgi:drug/metabolite transporter (DMT)-like permease